MQRFHNSALAAAVLLLAAGVAIDSGKHGSAAAAPAGRPLPVAELRAARQSPSDLEIGGDLAGLPPGSTRYLTRDDLLALPQVTHTVTDDSNFTGPTTVSGVPLEELIRAFGAAPQSDIAIAICSDKYFASYPRDYIAAHQPLLVLTINGQPPSGWPKSSGDQGQDMGPYLISHPKFTPAFTIHSHTDGREIPWGVVRIELRDEASAFGGILPRGPEAGTPMVQDGYRIAQQNCLHCHNMGDEGGQKSGVPWLVLSAWAAASPPAFAKYVRDPKSSNPRAQMPGNPGYDDATIAALAAYFRTFVPSSAGSASSSPPKREP